MEHIPHEEQFNGAGVTMKGRARLRSDLNIHINHT